MTDEERRQKLCEALRIAANPDRSINMPLCGIAADEIERLAAENGRLTQALIDNYAAPKIREQPRSDWIIRDD